MHARFDMTTLKKERLLAAGGFVLGRAVAGYGCKVDGASDIELYDRQIEAVDRRECVWPRDWRWVASSVQQRREMN